MRAQVGGRWGQLRTLRDRSQSLRLAWSAYAIWIPTCNMQHATRNPRSCEMQRATYNAQSRNMQHAIMRHATRNMQHAAATRDMQHAALPIPKDPYRDLESNDPPVPTRLPPSR